MFLRQPIIANDYFTIITIIGPTINRSDASLKSNVLLEDVYSLFCQRSLNLIDLRTFVAKFCREDLRTFSADFFGLKNGIRKLFCFLDV